MGKSGVGGTQLTEAKYINLSLHYLEQVHVRVASVPVAEHSLLVRSGPSVDGIAYSIHADLYLVSVNTVRGRTGSHLLLLGRFICLFLSLSR